MAKRRAEPRPAPSVATARPARRARLLVLGAALLAAAVHAPSIQFGLTRTDDKVLLNDDATFLQDARNIPRTLSRPFFPLASRGETYYRPVATTSFILDSQWAGLEPASFHATNVALHTAVTALLGLFLLRLGFPPTLAAPAPPSSACIPLSPRP